MLLMSETLIEDTSSGAIRIWTKTLIWRCVTKLCSYLELDTSIFEKFNKSHSRRQSQISLDRREDGQNRQHMLPAFVEFHFWFAKISDLSLTECVSPHHYLFNILKVTASWTKDRITSDSLMATLHTASSLLTAATRRTGRHCASRERSRALAREFLDWSEDWGSGHRQMLTISHQHSGVRTRAGRACSSALFDILHYYTLMQARNTVTSYLPFFLHLPTSFYSGKGFQKTELVFYIQLKWLKCWQREKLLEYIE